MSRPCCEGMGPGSEACRGWTVFRRLAGRENWLAVMKECPVSPDDVPPRRRELPNRRKL